MKEQFFLSILFLFLFPLFTAHCEPVKAWEETIDIPTYGWETDFNNPRFEEIDGSIIYPYAMQDILSPTKEMRTYRALCLENKYLKLICLPELGGRIHSVLDKTTGQEMFHRNDVIKPGLIGLRGAWIAGGVEWNTGPHGHTVTAMSPVDSTFVHHEDGSVTLALANTEQIFRTRWVVKVTMRPGRSFLEEDIRIYNPTDGVHPYYFWNCTSFPVTKGTRFIFPMSLGCDHNGKEFFNWPIHEGKDLSWLKNYDEPTSIFAWDCPQDFFGAYDVERDFGLVQTADHRFLPGKKAWTWGQSDDGIVSQKALMDDGTQYIEVQSGPLRTQADYGLLYPHEDVSWKEYWYPVHGLGDGFDFANENVAVNGIQRNDGKWDLRILGTGEFKGCKLAIQSALKKGIEPTSLELSTASPLVTTVRGEPDTYTILDSEDNVLAKFDWPVDIPEVPEPAPNWIDSVTQPEGLTAEQIYLKAKKFDQESNRLKAREWYAAALQKDASHVESLLGLAILDFESGLYGVAQKKLKHALARDPERGWAWYYLGLCQYEWGNLERANESASKAARYLRTSSAPYDLLGRVALEQGNFKVALDCLRRGLTINPQDISVAVRSIPARYFNGEKEAIEMISWAILEVDPLCFFAKTVIRPDLTLDRMAEEFRREMGNPKYTMTGIGISFENLKTGTGVLPIGSGLLYQSTKLPGTSESEMWASQVPWQQVSMPNFNDAQSVNFYASFRESLRVLPQDPQNSVKTPFAALLKANLLAGLCRIREAVPYWEAVIEAEPGCAMAQRNLGVYNWKIEKDLGKAAKHLQAALEAVPEDQTFRRDLAKVLIESGSRSHAIALIEELPRQKLRRSDLIEILAQGYIDEARYDAALDLLSESSFSNWEGRTVSRSLFAQAHFERGKIEIEAGRLTEALADFKATLEYPEHLGVGRPAHPEEAQSFYWIGKTLEAQGNFDEAITTWHRGRQGKEDPSAQEAEYRRKCEQELQRAGG